MSVLSSPHFHDEAKAFEFLESVVWAGGVVCPHCGVVNGRVYDLADVRGKPSKKSPEGAIRYGLKKCGECRQQFTAKVGTVFEHARMPLHKMLQAVHLMVSSKKGISAYQLSRILEVQYKSAWFLAHRIREAMRDGDLPPMGGNGSIVEADETYIGNRKGVKRGKGGGGHKMRVVSLVDRSTGKARSFDAHAMVRNEVSNIFRANVDREFESHESVLHAGHKYVRGDVHTNTIEGFFSIFKRGMRGVYQHCSEQHLHPYLAEFDFRYTHRQANGIDDRARSFEAMKGIIGKRLMYKGAN